MALVCSFFAINTTNAQTETYYGAEKGSFALSIGADPVINFVGNMFNGTQDNYLGNLGGTIAGKYFVSENFAITAELGINNFKSTEFFYTYDDEDKEDVTGKGTIGSRSFFLGLGAQYYFRPGKRLQPFIGANIYYGRSNSFISAVSDDDETLVQVGELVYDEWNDEYYGDGVLAIDGQHKISSPVNTFAVMANIGVEYFLKENISVSATLDLGVRTDTYRTVSEFDMADVEKATEKANNYNYKTRRDTYFATGLTGGKIAFNFYF